MKRQVTSSLMKRNSMKYHNSFNIVSKNYNLLICNLMNILYKNLPLAFYLQQSQKKPGKIG